MFVPTSSNIRHGTRPAIRTSNGGLGMGIDICNLASRVCSSAVVRDSAETSNYLHANLTCVKSWRPSCLILTSNVNHLEMPVPFEYGYAWASEDNTTKYPHSFARLAPSHLEPYQHLLDFSLVYIRLVSKREISCTVDIWKAASLSDSDTLIST